jgi:cytochrome b561
MEDIAGNAMYYAAYTHFVLGVILWLIAIYRIRLHFKHKRPTYPQQVTRFSRKIATFVQFTMLGLLTIQPVIGLLFAINYPPSEWESPKSDFVYFLYEAHELVAYGLFILIALHILGYFRHLIVDRINLINRMW